MDELLARARAAPMRKVTGYTWCNTAALLPRPKGARRSTRRLQPSVSKQNSDVASPRRAAAAMRAAASIIAAAAMRAAAAAAASTCEWWRCFVSGSGLTRLPMRTRLGQAAYRAYYYRPSYRHVVACTTPLNPACPCPARPAEASSSAFSGIDTLFPLAPAPATRPRIFRRSPRATLAQREIEGQIRTPSIIQPESPSLRA
jgi:hypothetical protein